MDAQWAEQAQSAAPLAMDADIAGLPSNLEEVAFTNGDKPVLYLVLPVGEADALATKYPGATFVRREIPLTVERVTGRRVYAADGAEKKTHVFISNDAALAHRAAHLWDEGSSRNAVAIGELLGYPPCCVAAFLALGERGNNAALTYVTAARSCALGAAYRAVLNSTVRHVLPCTPCSFGCSRAEALAERVLGALPENVSTPLRRALARPVLYFDEARAVVFEGARVHGSVVEYEQARFLPAPAPLGVDDELFVRRMLGALFASPGKLFVNGDVFELHSRGVVRRFERQGSQLGIVLPFGGAEHSG